MSRIRSRIRSRTRAGLLAILLIQALTHLFWLPIAAHSGQVAIPWMMNQGKVLFSDLLEQHAPGSSVLAAIAQTILPFEPVDVARLLNLVVVLAITLLVYGLARELAHKDDRAGFLAAAVWFWWEPVYGNILLYFDTLLGLCVLVALVLWMRDESRQGWGPLLAGLLMGSATAFKQHAWGAVVLFLLWLLIFHRERRTLMAYIGGVIVVPAAMHLIIIASGTLDTYLYWNWTFNFSGLMDGVPLDGGLFRKLLLTNILAGPFLLMALQREANCKGRDCLRPDWLLVGLMWAATSVVLYPRFGEIHAMAHLPLLAAMSGVVLAMIWPSDWKQLLQARPAELTLAGLLVMALAGWLWTGAVTYLPGDVFAAIGRGGTLAYDEYSTLVEQIDTISEPGDTLFVLPETDSTPQLHPMTGLLPPGTWIKGWHWYFEAPGLLDSVLTEWQMNPPDIVVVFPEMLASGEPGILSLLAFVQHNYTTAGRVPDVFLHGPAVLYILNTNAFTQQR